MPHAWYDNLSLRAKLALGSCGVVGLFALLGLMALRDLGQLNGSARELAVNGLPSVQIPGAMKAAVADLRMLQYAQMVADDADGRDALLAQASVEIRAMATLLRQLGALVDNDAKRDALRALERHWIAYVAGHEKVALLTGEFGTRAMVGSYARVFADMNDNLDRWVELGQKDAHAQADAAQATYNAARLRMLLGAAWCSAVGLTLAFWQARRIALPLAAAGRCVRAVAEGDLTQRIERTGRDEVGQLLDALAGMQDGLRRLVTEVRGGVDAVATASAEMADGNRDLSQRTDQQAANLQQAAASIEQMTATVVQTSESSQQANDLVTGASGAASRGGEVVGQVVATMGQITESAQRIGDIIGVIDGIAFQTNILALNAAVEAARAGEQGRGFAVVASEVRSLAQRSAEAAREIKLLITSSVEQVRCGSALVGRAGHTMQDIMTQVNSVAALIGHIHHASSEQSNGIRQVHGAVTQLDRMTQQNAALVQQSAAATESMEGQVKHLTQSLAAFRLA